MVSFPCWISFLIVSASLFCSFGAVVSAEEHRLLERQLGPGEECQFTSQCGTEPQERCNLVCIDGKCQNQIAPNGKTCSNGRFCDGEELCFDGECRPEVPPCGVPEGEKPELFVCITQCNEEEQNCFAPEGEKCQDELFCTVDEYCDGQGSCVGKNPCYGGSPCNSQCNEAASNCFNPQGTSCNDDVFCNGVDRCSGNGFCVHTEVPCVGLPGSVCLTTCNEQAENCLAPNTTLCESDENSCTADVCNGGGACIHPPTSGACDDGSDCTADDICTNGVCFGEFICACEGNIDCDDNNPCTDDVCTVDQTCEYTPNNATCSDGIWCNGASDSCSGGTCSVHTAIPCPIGNPCVSCNEVSQNCIAPAGVSCSNGLFCDGLDQCDGAGTCVSPGDPCTENGLCRDQCNEELDNCFAANGTAVDDGLFCNGIEKCDGAGNVIEATNPCSGSPNPCARTCNELLDTCNAPNGTRCQDSIWCNGEDKCDGAGTCIHSGSPCSNFDSCEQCNEANDTCLSERGQLCEDDGNFCNGIEICDGSGACISPGSPCVQTNPDCVTSCNDQAQACVLTSGDSKECGFIQGDAQANENSLSMGTIGGIAGGIIGICACCVLALIVVVVISRKKSRRRSDAHLPTIEDIPMTGYAAISGVHLKRPTTNPIPGYAPYSANNSAQSLQGLIPLPSKRSTMSSGHGSIGDPSSWEIPYAELIFEQKIGSGAFGQVFMGRWRGGQVAIKCLINQSLTDDQLQAFQAEAALMASLRPHANVVQFLGACSQPGHPLSIVTEYMKGGSLYDYVHNSEITFTDSIAINWIRGIAYGMLHLHRENIIHRDLAIRNVLLSDENTVKITDFGMSRATDGNSAAKTNAEVGPLKYMSPEALLERSYSTKSDVWSFGITVMEILTRDEPYPELDTVMAATKVTHGLKPTVPAWVHPSVSQLLVQCWATNPQERPDFQQISLVVENITQLRK